MKLELKHLALYLPYGLKMTFNLPNNPNQTGKLLALGTTLDGYLTAHVQLSDTEVRQIRFGGEGKKSMCKPVLRPLSDLTSIDGLISSMAAVAIGSVAIHNIGPLESLNETAILFDCNGYENPLVFYYSKKSFHLFINDGAIRLAVNNQWQLFDILFEHHFDVFGLIDAGLAINIL